MPNNPRLPSRARRGSCECFAFSRCSLTRLSNFSATCTIRIKEEGCQTIEKIEPGSREFRGGNLTTYHFELLLPLLKCEMLMDDRVLPSETYDLRAVKITGKPSIYFPRELRKKGEEIGSQQEKGGGTRNREKP